MPKARLLVPLLVAASAGLSPPAAAVRVVELGAITDTVSVTADTGDYDAWAADCPNITVSGTCDPAGLSAVSTPGANDSIKDRNLFFWGQQGDPDNTSIRIEWTADDPSEDIRYVRVQTVGTDPLGQPDGPRPFNAFGSSFTATFAAGAGQGEGLFLAYGRDVYAFDDGGGATETEWEITRKAISPFSAELEFGVDGPGTGVATGGVIVLADPQDLFSPLPGLGISSAVANPLTDTTGGFIVLSDDDQGELVKGGASLELELFVDEPDGYEFTPGNVPAAYLDDVVIQLNPGPRIGVTPEAVVLENTRAGTRSAAQAITVENIGEALNAIDQDGNAVVNEQLDFDVAAFSSSGSPLQATDGGAAVGIALDAGASWQRGYELDATGIALTLDDAGEIGDSFSANQAITVDSDDFGANQTRNVSGLIAGPVLGVFGQADPDTAAQTLAYESTIDLGDLDIGETTTSVLAVGNLFGANLEEVTDLTIQNVALDDEFGGRFSLLGVDGSGGCTLPNPYTSGAIVGEATGNETDQFQLPDLCISFEPGSYPGGGTVTGQDERTVVFDTTLRFFTDMNMALGSTPAIGDAGEKFFDLRVSAVYAVTPSAPVPAPLALIGIGLAGLGGLRARSRRGAEPKRRAG